MFSATFYVFTAFFCLSKITTLHLYYKTVTVVALLCREGLDVPFEQRHIALLSVAVCFITSNVSAYSLISTRLCLILSADSYPSKKDNDI